MKDYMWLLVIAPSVTLLVAFIGYLIKASVWKGQVDRFMQSTDTLMAEIRADIKKIFERLPAPKPIEGVSPVRLTHFGEIVSRKRT